MLKLANHRDFVLLLALVFGLLLGESSRFLADLSLPILMLAMVASTVDFSFKSWSEPSKIIKPIMSAFALSYLVYGAVVLSLAWLLFYNRGMELIWIGFVIIVAVPPGPAVVSFSAMLKGDSNYATTGLLGMYLIATLLTPALLFVLVDGASVSPLLILGLMVQIVIIPIAVSRLLRFPGILPAALRTSRTAIKWLFFLILTPIIGMNRELLFNDFSVLFSAVFVIALAMFGLGSAYTYLMAKRGMDRGTIISSTFMLTTKGSAVAAVIAFRFFEDDPVVAMPAAVVSIFTVLFALFYSTIVRLVLDRNITEEKSRAEAR